MKKRTTQWNLTGVDLPRSKKPRQPKLIGSSAKASPAVCCVDLFLAVFHRSATDRDAMSDPKKKGRELLALHRKRKALEEGRSPTKAPEEISVDMVMTTLKGTGAHLECIEEPLECTLSSTCAQREVWRSVEDTIHSLLSSTTIADLANRQRQLATQNMHQG